MGGASREIVHFQLFQADNGQIWLHNEAYRFRNDISIAFKSKPVLIVRYERD
jgi:hypothetical protein